MEVILNDFHSIDKEYEILERTCDLAIQQALNTFYRESAMEELSSSLFLEEDDFDFNFDDEEPTKPQPQQKNQNGQIGKKPGVLQSIIGAIQRLFNSFINMIQNIFGKKQNMSAEDYLKAPNTKIQLEADIDKMADALDRELVEGRTIIQKISSNTGVDPQMVASYTDMAASAIKKFVIPMAIPAFSAWAINKVVRKKMNNMKKTVDETANDIKNNPDSDPKKQQQKINILNAMKEKVSTFFKPVEKCAKDLKSLEKDELKNSDNSQPNGENQGTEKKSWFRSKKPKEKKEEDPDKAIWKKIHAAENMKSHTIDAKQKAYYDSQIESYKSQLKNKEESK